MERLQSVRQAEAFLAGRGKRLEEASRADLEAFLGDLLRRRAPATAATRYKVCVPVICQQPRRTPPRSTP